MDPKLENRSGGREPSRKARQLCAQAAEALSFALADSADSKLSGLVVLAVDPMPDTSRLVATVTSSVSESLDPVEILERLDRAAPRLRAEVARSITRRRAPTLAFRFVVKETP